MNRGLERKRIERVARMYRQNKEASQALGITLRSFSRLCRKYEIETPYNRKRRCMQEARAGFTG